MWAKTSSTINEKCDIFRALFSSFTNYNYLITSNWSFKCRLCFMWTRQTEQHGGGWRDGWKREHLELYPKFHTKYNRIQCKYILAVVFLPNFAVCVAEELKSKESGVKAKQKKMSKRQMVQSVYGLFLHISPLLLLCYCEYSHFIRIYPCLSVAYMKNPLFIHIATFAMWFSVLRYAAVSLTNVFGRRTTFRHFLTGLDDVDTRHTTRMQRKFGLIAFLPDKIDIVNYLIIPK